MAVFARFWRQENKAYRNMQVVFTLLALNFFIPSLSYFFTPDLALSQLRSFGALLGAPDYPLAEQSHVWRVLAAGNVFTLGFICLLLQINIKRFHSTIPVFVVLKAFSALGYLYVYLFELHYRVFLAVFFWDGLAVFLVVHFGGRAYRSLADSKQALVPRPTFSGQ